MREKVVGGAGIGSGRARVFTAGAVLAIGGAFLFGLAGCADLSFKPGASPDEIRRDELACRETAGEDEAAYASCMKARGYLVSKTGEAVDWTPASR